MVYQPLSPILDFIIRMKQVYMPLDNRLGISSTKLSAEGGDWKLEK